MKIPHLVQRFTVIITSLLSIKCGHAQGNLGDGTFINLNFESATIPPNSGSMVSTAQALPGWAAFVGSSPQTTVSYDVFALTGESISLIGPNSPYQYGPIDGNYSVKLLGSQIGGGGLGVSIAQTAILPVGANSVEFVTTSAGAPFGMSVNGTPIPLAVLGMTSLGTIVGGNVSQFAGETATLAFSAGNMGGLYFDDITFSSESVPEPKGELLGLMGAMLLAWRLRKRG